MKNKILIITALGTAVFGVLCLFMGSWQIALLFWGFAALEIVGSWLFDSSRFGSPEARRQRERRVYEQHKADHEGVTKDNPTLR